MNKCPACGSVKLVSVDDVMYDFSGRPAYFPGERCTKCQHEFIDENSPFILTIKKNGMWEKAVHITREQRARPPWNNLVRPCNHVLLGDCPPLRKKTRAAKKKAN